MPGVLRRNALIVLGLCFLFCWSFFFAKHNSALQNVIPFGGDPYDAVGSFAVIAGTIIASISLVRAFRPYREQPSSRQHLYLIRSQEAVILAIFMTLVSDIVAMVRHLSMWIGSPSRDALMVLVSGMALATVAVQWIVYASQKEKIAESRDGDRKIAISGTVLAIVVLSIYPEKLIDGTATHLLTVVVGAIVLFVPIRLLLKALVPCSAETSRMSRPQAGNRFLTAKRPWIIVVLAGALIGAFAFLSEIAEGHTVLSIGRLVFVASVFIGLGLAGLVIAYATLREPLGLEML